MYKHLRHVNRQNLKTIIQRFKNAKYYQNKHDKKIKKKSKKKSKKNQNDQIMISKILNSIKNRKTIKKIKTTTTTILKKILIIKNHNYIDKLKKKCYACEK